MYIERWIALVALSVGTGACTDPGGGDAGSTGGPTTTGSETSTVSASGMMSGTGTGGFGTGTATTADDGTTSFGPGTGTDSGETPRGEFGCWSIDALIEEPGISGGNGVAASQDGVRVGTSIPDGLVYATDLNGAFQWDFEVSVGTDASVMAVAAMPDGSTLAAARAPAGGGSEVWLGRLSAAGSLDWETTLGPTSNQAWTTAHMAAAQDGDMFVAWDHGGGLGVSRIDPSTGNSAWTELTSYRPSLINWSRGGLATTPTGDALSLLRYDYGLELELRSGVDGALLADIVVTEPAFVDATPADVEVLGDGAIFVLANSDDGPALLEVGLDGSIVASHLFTSVDDPYANVMAWDPTTERFLISGTGRLPRGTKRPWRLTTDRNGATELDALGGMPFSITDGLSSAAFPGGGFVETRFSSLFAYTITCR